MLHPRLPTRTPTPTSSLQAEECVEEEMESGRLCKIRLDHLKSYAAGEQTEGMKRAWRKTRVDRMLVDHFLRAGHYSTALKLAESSGIKVMNSYTVQLRQCRIHTVQYSRTLLCGHQGHFVQCSEVYLTL